MLTGTAQAMIRTSTDVPASISGKLVVGGDARRCQVNPKIVQHLYPHKGKFRLAI